MNGNEKVSIGWARLALGGDPALEGLSDGALEAAQQRLESAASRIQAIRSRRVARPSGVEASEPSMVAPQ